MPVKSAKQYRFMAGIAHGMKPKSGVGPSPEVAKKFVDETPAEKRSIFSKHNKKRRDENKAPRNITGVRG